MQKFKFSININKIMDMRNNCKKYLLSFGLFSIKEVAIIIPRMQPRIQLNLPCTAQKRDNFSTICF